MSLICMKMNLFLKCLSCPAQSLISWWETASLTRESSWGWEMTDISGYEPVGARIFIWMVSHEGSFWYKGKRQLSQQARLPAAVRERSPRSFPEHFSGRNVDHTRESGGNRAYLASERRHISGCHLVQLFLAKLRDSKKYVRVRRRRTTRKLLTSHTTYCVPPLFEIQEPNDALTIYSTLWILWSSWFGIRKKMICAWNSGVLPQQA